MDALIPSPAACEVRSVIKFLNAKSIEPIEIYRQLCQVYGPNIMNKQMVRRWCRQFSEGRQSAHDEERSGRPSLINDDLVELVRQGVMENRRFTITDLSSHFPQISRSFLHEIVPKLDTKQLFCWNFAGSCLIIHPTALIFLPAIFMFSCTSRNSRPSVRVLATTTI